MIGPSTRLKPRPDVRYRVIDGQAVVIVQDSTEALVLNEIGTRVLELADGERPLSSLLEQLAAEYDVEPERLEEDVVAYLDDLLSAGVLIRV